MSKHQCGIFIFRRDLRLTDNTGLIAALKECKSIIPCFIFDPRQVESTNPYRSLNCIQFMLTSLRELDTALKEKNGRLYFFMGDPTTIIKNVITATGATAIYANRDYTPFSKSRDQKIAQIAQEQNIDFTIFNDALLTTPEEVFTGSHEPYKVFTPFFKKASELPVQEPQANNFNSYFTKPIVDSLQIGALKNQDWVAYKNKDIFRNGGRTEALKILRNLHKFKNYKDERNIPALEGTTGLSAHNKFGTISIREFYHAIVKELGHEHTLISELYWRDFFTHIAFHFPHVFGHSFNQQYDNLEWSYNTDDFERWRTGTTGFPIVDAGMRQMNATGFMHNRVRMIVASFLTKDLHIDWRWGEQYFATQLIDYDPAVNNGNWQWAASTGCDAQPYFRIFNPWLQQTKFDPDAIYIKRWIPELANLSAKEIHKWESSNHSYKGYPAPMVDHKIQAQKAKTLFKKVLS